MFELLHGLLIILQCNWFHVIIWQIVQEDLLITLVCFDFTEKCQFFSQSFFITSIWTIITFWNIFREINLLCMYPHSLLYLFTIWFHEKFSNRAKLWDLLSLSRKILRELWPFFADFAFNLTEKWVKTADFGDFCVNRN